MSPLPRNNNAPENIKLYKSLGALIKDYRQWRKLSQEKLAASVGISVRELQNWEANRHRVRIGNMHDLAEFAGLPMQVCIALNADQPVWYSLRNKRFALSSFEKEFSSSPDLLRYHSHSGTTELLHDERIATDKQIRMIMANHQDIYGGGHHLQVDVLEAAVRLLPELNRIIFDCWGHYVGHQICLPMTKDVYAEIRKRETCEGYLTSDKISDILALRQGVFYIYSIFSTNMSVGYAHSITSLRYLNKIAQKNNYLVAISSATKEGQIYLRNLGFRPASKHYRQPDRIHPKIYEIELAVLTQPLGPFGALNWILDEVERKEKVGDRMGNVQQEMLPPPIPRLQRPKRSRPGHEYFTEKTDGGPLTVVGPLTVEKGVQNNHRQEILTCPNRACNARRKGEKANIISNGTYWTKDGVSARRFLCKECGGSFCSRAGSIFYGLRSPQEKVLTAFKLLSKGMSLRGVTKVLGVKHHTIRHWLTLMAGQSNKIDSLLMEQLQVSTIEIETLRSIAKKRPALNNVS